MHISPVNKNPQGLPTLQTQGILTLLKVECQKDSTLHWYTVLLYDRFCSFDIRTGISNYGPFVIHFDVFLVWNTLKVHEIWNTLKVHEIYFVVNSVENLTVNFCFVLNCMLPSTLLQMWDLQTHENWRDFL